MYKKSKQTFKKFLVSLLIIALLSTCSGYYNIISKAAEAVSEIDINLQTDKNDQTVSEDTTKDSSGAEPKIIKELPEERTEYSTVFLNDDGSKTAKFYSAPIRYKDDNNKLVDIDSSLIVLSGDKKSVNNSTYDYGTKATEVKSYLPANLSIDNPILVTYGDYFVSLLPIENQDKDKASLDSCKALSKSTATISKESDVDLYTNNTVEKDKTIKYSGIKSNEDGCIDFEYTTLNDGIKENIILNSKPQTNRFSFLFDIKNAYPELTEYGAVVFKDNKTNEEIGAIPAPYMTDSSEDTAYSTDVYYELTKVEGKYILTVVASEEYLNSSKTVYPVTIDPSITLNGNTNVTDVYVKSGYPNTNFYSSDTRLMPVGYGAELISRTYVKFPTLSATINGKVITSATFNAKQNYTGTIFCTVQVLRVVSSWSTTTLTWNNRPSASDCGVTPKTNTGSGAWISWNVANLLGTWANGTYSNYGILLKATVESGSNYDDYFGSRTATTSYRPYLSVTYQNPSILNYATVMDNPDTGINAGYSEAEINFSKVTGASKYYLNITGADGGSTISRDITNECTDEDTSFTWDSTGKTIFEGYTGFPNSSGDVLNGSGDYILSVKAVNAYDVGVNSNTETLTLPDNTAPESVSAVSIDSAEIDSIDPYKADLEISFPATWDLPNENGMGMAYYKVALCATINGNETVIEEQQVDDESLETYTCSFPDIDYNLNNLIIRVIAYDIQGNYSEATRSNAIVFPDTVGPSAPSVTINPSDSQSITISTPAYVNQNEATINWNELIDNKTKDYDVKVYYRLATGTINNPTYITDEVQIGVGQSGYANISIESLTEGNEYLVIVYGIDANGNVGDLGYSLLIKDLTSPTADITSPVEESDIDGNVSIVGTISDSNIANWTLYYKKTGFPWLSSYTHIATGTENVNNNQLNATLLDTSSFTAGAEYRFMLEVTDKAGNKTVIYRNYTKISEGSTVLPSFEINPSPREDWKINTYDYTFELDPDFGYTIPQGQKTLFIDGNYIGDFGINDDIETDLSDISSFPDSSVHNAVVRIVDSTTGEESYSSTVIKRDLFNYDMTPNNDLTASGDAILTASGATLDLSQASPTSGDIVTIEKTINGKIASIKLAAADTTPANTAVTYSLSINNSDYFDIAKDARIYAEDLTTLGIQNNDTSNTVKVKITLASTDGIAYPTVTSLDVDSTQFTSNVNSLFYVTVSPYGVKDYQDFVEFSTQSGDANINPLTGNMIYSKSDFSVDSPVDLMEFSRSYNSQSTYSTILGQGWDFSYNIYITKVFDESQNIKEALVKLGDGDVYRFEKNQDGSYTGPNGLYATLTYDAITSKYLLTFKDKSEYLFNTDNKIEQITDRNGNWMQFVYNANGIATITDNVGNVMTFTYSAETGEEGLLKTILCNNRIYEYDYTSGKLTNTYIYYYNIVENNPHISLEQYTYTNGLISVITNSNGDIYKIEYDSSNKIVKMTDPLNQVMTFDYTSDNNDVKLAVNYLNAINKYYFDSSSLALKKSIDPYNNSIDYEYDANFNITEKTFTDNSGAQAVVTIESYEYNDDGNVTLFTDKAGRDTTYLYNDTDYTDKASQVTEPFNSAEDIVTVNDYDTHGNVLQTYVDGTNQTINYTYNAQGNMLTQVITITNPTTFETFTNETDYSYEAKGRLRSTTVVDPVNQDNNLTSTQDYDIYGNIRETKDPKQGVIDYLYDIFGNQTTVTMLPVTEPAVSTYKTYDHLGNVLTEKDAKGRVTYYTYDKLKRLTSVIYPNGTCDWISYIVRADEMLTENSTQIESGTQVEKHKNADGTESVKIYDKKAQVITEGTLRGQNSNDVDISTIPVHRGYKFVTYTDYTYNGSGNAISTKDRTGAENRNTYDSMGNMLLSSVYDNNGIYKSQTEYTYDYANNLLTEVSSDGTSTENTYDKLNRVTSVTKFKNNVQVSETNYTYNSVIGNTMQNTLTDPNGRDTVYEFDSKGRMIKETYEGRETSYTYDDNGNILTSALENDTDFNGESAQTEYTYDELDRKISETYTVTGKTEQAVLYTYDANDNVISKELKEGGVSVSTVNYAYDSLNRVTKVVKDNVTVAIYTYTASGNVESVQYGDSAASKKIAYVYNENNSLIEVRDQTAGADNALLRAYNYEYGILKSITDYRSGSDTAIQEFAYDSLNRLSNVKYYAVNSTTNVLEEYTLIYDDSNNKITSETIVTNYDNTPVTTNKAYTYDAQGRLATETQTIGTDETVYEYFYDTVGNRTQMHKTVNQTETIYTYEYDHSAACYYDQLTAIKEDQNTIASYTYDLCGNQVSKTEGSVTTTYAYNSANWLKSVTQGSTTLGTYSYDANGQRTQKVVGTNTTNYYYNGTDLLYTKDNSNNIIEENILEPDGSMVCSKKSDYNYYWYRQDIRGSVTNIVSAADAVAKSYAYDAYGNTTVTDNNTNIVNSFAYAKAVIDTETGLYYMNARYYDPETGRFISQDTYRGTGEAFWHLYLYCDSDPVNHIDPSGHWLLDAVFLAADVVSFIKKPSLGKALWIVADLLCFLDPSGVASTLAHAGKVAKVAKAAKVLKSKKIVKAAKTVKNTITESKTVKRVTETANTIGCFTADTLIITKDGYKQIKDIKAGDEVYSENPITGEKSLKKVVETFIHEKYTIVNVYINETKIETTEEHPFWVEGKGWVSAGELKVGDKLLLYSNDIVEVTNLELVHLNNPIKVYNFEVEDWHTYFVSGDSVLVHNMCAGPVKGVKRIENITKQESKIWKGFKNYKKDIKTSGSGNSKKYYTWDNTHKDIEVYDNKFKHLGSMNPSTGKMYKPPVKGRTLKL